MDAPDPELPGRLGRRQRAHPRVQQRRRARLLPQRGLRRGPASGRHRRRGRRLDGSRRSSTPGRSPGPRRHRLPCHRPPASGTGRRAPAAASGRPTARRTARRRPARLGGRRARPADRPGRRGGGPRGHPADPSVRVGAAGTPGADRRADDVSHPDDPDADTDGLDTTELLRRELGAEVIDEIPHS